MFDLFPAILMTTGGQMILELPESESEFLAVKESAVVASGKFDERRFDLRFLIAGKILLSSGHSLCMNEFKLNFPFGASEYVFNVGSPNTSIVR